MSRKLNDLSDRFRPLACELIARCAEAGVPVQIVDTRRTPEEQAANVANGVSWTQRSKHLTGDAMDIAPYATFELHGRRTLQWDGADAAWQTIGRFAESLGLRWGGRWTKPDLGHVEYREPSA